MRHRISMSGIRNADATRLGGGRALDAERIVNLAPMPAEARWRGHQPRARHGARQAPELRQTGLSAIKPPFRGARAMKDGIHPDYHEITVMMTDGTTYQTRSTYGKAGDTLRLEIDSKSHPAWTGGQQRLLDSGGQLARFNKRFQGFGLKK
jgi:large subunit ribosomal protein L31